MAVNPYRQYQEQSIMTMTQGELVVKLYEGCLKQLNAAVYFLDASQFDKSNTALQKAQRIVNYLDASLDMNYEVSENLHALYDYFERQIISANIKKNPEPIREIIPMIDGLRDSFKQAEKKVHMK